MSNPFTHAGNLIIGGFVIMVLMMSYLIFKCTQQDFQMVADDYYAQELVFQQKIDATANATPYGEGFKVYHQADKVLLQLPQELSQQLDKGSVTFYCASDGHQDRTFEVAASNSGEYAFATTDWKKTGYKVRVSLSAYGKDYYREMYIAL